MSDLIKAIEILNACEGRAEGAPPPPDGASVCGYHVRISSSTSSSFFYISVHHPPFPLWLQLPWLMSFAPSDFGRWSFFFFFFFFFFSPSTRATPHNDVPKHVSLLKKPSHHLTQTPGAPPLPARSRRHPRTASPLRCGWPPRTCSRLGSPGAPASRGCSRHSCAARWRARRTATSPCGSWPRRPRISAQRGSGPRATRRRSSARRSGGWAGRGTVLWNSHDVFFFFFFFCTFDITPTSSMRHGEQCKSLMHRTIIYILYILLL
jgi:hypothetical protein